MTDYAGSTIPGNPSLQLKSRRYPPLIVRGRRRWAYRAAIALWLGCVVFFWAWWLQPGHVIHAGRYWLVTAALFWVFYLQGYFFFFALRARRAEASLDDLGQFRAAMVVTKTPSEPFPIVRRTLEAMLAQDVPHDTWLADEDPAAETVAWCGANGVKISTRKGVEAYHRATWPRRTRCKEGNLAYFYDHFGYEGYDFVAQLDADHVPQPGYLREMLSPFADPGVGYVSAPSICAANGPTSWSARARLHTEVMFHGAMQAGYSGGWAPMCIGSHYAVRTTALKAVGGLGPELAEDHSTSMLMNAGGWRGVHAIDAIAIGDGPETFPDMITQEFQWSRSLLSLLLRHTPDYFARLPARLKFQFVFSQVWYPIFAVFMGLVYLLPITALLFDIRWADVTYPAFLGHSLPATIALLLIAGMLRRDLLFRPVDGRILSWEKVLFPVAQWLWVLWGCAVAVYDRLTGRFVDFRITPKGMTGPAPLPLRVVLPPLILALGSLLPVLLIGDIRETAGFYVLALINAVLYTALFLVVVALHPRPTGGSQRRLTAGSIVKLATSAALIVLVGFTVWLRGAQGVHAITAGMGPVKVVKVVFPVSGAGDAPPGTVYYEFDFEWSGNGQNDPGPRLATGG